MQPTEHKHKNDEELIAHIKQSLKTHEEGYQLGAWERFNEQQGRKKRPIFWLVRLSGAAAILAVCFSLIWFATTDGPKNEELAKIIAPKNEQPTNNSKDVDAPEFAKMQLATANTKMSGTHKETTALTGNNETLLTQGGTPSTNVQAVVPTENVVAPTMAVTTAVTPQIDNQQVIAKVEEKIGANALDLLMDESQTKDVKKDKLAVNKKYKRWEVGFMLAPSFGNSKELNLGYGLSMSYNFSDRLSLTSGIAYNKMNTSKNLPTKIGMSPILMGNVKNLEMISEEVTGIDIPLELKYQINKNVYANLGVSGLAVINQSRNNTFVEEIVVKRTANVTSSIGGASGSSGSADVIESQKGQFANSYIVNQRTTERASGAAIEGVNYIGFYNFSVGYTKKIYKNHALSIEPFIKLPIKVVTQDNLRLMGTGVRLKVGF